MIPETESPKPVAANVQDQKVPAVELINGGRKLRVTLLTGETKDVVINLVPISKVPEYLEKIGDPAAFIDFVSGQKAGFCDTIDEDSFYAIDDAAKELNDPRIDRYAKRQQVTVQRLTGLQLANTG